MTHVSHQSACCHRNIPRSGAEWLIWTPVWALLSRRSPDVTLFQHVQTDIHTLWRCLFMRSAWITLTQSFPSRHEVFPRTLTSIRVDGTALRRKGWDGFLGRGEGLRLGRLGRWLVIRRVRGEGRGQVAVLVCALTGSVTVTGGGEGRRVCSSGFLSKDLVTDVFRMSERLEEPCLLKQTETVGTRKEVCIQLQHMNRLKLIYVLSVAFSG